MLAAASRVRADVKHSRACPRNIPPIPVRRPMVGYRVLPRISADVLGGGCKIHVSESTQVSEYFISPIDHFVVDLVQNFRALMIFIVFALRIFSMYRFRSGIDCSSDMAFFTRMRAPKTQSYCSMSIGPSCIFSSSSLSSESALFPTSDIDTSSDALDFLCFLTDVGLSAALSLADSGIRLECPCSVSLPSHVSPSPPAVPVVLVSSSLTFPIFALFSFSPLSLPHAFRLLF